jgi:hypothetical protein
VREHEWMLDREHVGVDDDLEKEGIGHAVDGGPAEIEAEQ